MNLLLRPDKVQSRDAFRTYVDAMLQSLNQALANPGIPYGPALDDHGVEWQNTTLATFTEAMHAWMEAWGWTEVDRTQSLVWVALGLVPGHRDGGEGALKLYLADLRDWAFESTGPEGQPWVAAAQALAAGRAYE